MATEKETLVLDLDAKDAVKNILSLKGSIESLGDESNLAGLISGLTKASAAIAIVGTAVFGVKAALDTVLEGEAILKINKQFEILASNAGFAADVLKNQLVGAADGLADDTDILKTANEVLAMMGDNAARLPDLMELARKQTQIFGGDFLDRFRAMAQAVETGNMRVLKSVGINIDAQTATLNYAKSVGKMVDELTDAEKKQAILNAVIAQGNEKTKGIATSTDSVTSNLKRLGVVFEQIGEALTLFFTKIFQPYFNSAIKLTIEFAERLKNLTLSVVGDDAEKAAAKLAMLQKELKDNQDSLKTLEQYIKTNPFAKSFPEAEQDAERLRKKIEELNAEIKQAEAERKPAVVGKTKPEADPAELAKSAAVRSKFYEDLAALRLKDLDNQIAMATSEEQVRLLTSEKIKQIEIQRDQEIALLREQAKLKNISDADLEVQIAAATSEAKRKAMDAENDMIQKQIAALDRLAMKADSTGKQFAASFQSAAKKSSSNMTTFGHLGDMTFKMLQSGATTAFKQFGIAAAGGAMEMRRAMLSAIGEIAESKGAQFIAEAIAEINPVKGAAGATLVALGSFLKAKAGGGGSSPPMAAGGAGGAPEATIAATTTQVPEARTDELEQRRKPREVSVNIMGHYFETPETRRVLTEMLRQESDATQFTIAQIGQGA